MLDQLAMKEESISSGDIFGHLAKDRYSSSRSFAARRSAEWILEAPTVGGKQTKLPKVSTALFGSASTFVKAGTTYELAQGSPVKIVMVKGNGSREATPSAIGRDQQSFNDCSYATSCIAP